VTWDDIRNNWQHALSDLRTRFPLVDHRVVETPPDSLSTLTEHVAARHDLTATEAIEEITDWMFVVSLARMASELGHEVSDQ
jgi:hypothetical protein